jgi:hypothetical protein
LIAARFGINDPDEKKTRENQRIFFATFETLLSPRRDSQSRRMPSTACRAAEWGLKKVSRAGSVWGGASTRMRRTAQTFSQFSMPRNGIRA